MKTTIQVAALVATASAAVLRRDQCCFHITASGSVSGLMGQLSDGQNRINGSYPPATYCYDYGAIMDSYGRGCVVTYTNDATHQFQCDLNSAPSYGFFIASNGSILYEGSPHFYACPATDTEYNVYTTWLKDQDKCRPITLSTNGTCAGGNAIPSESAPACSISVDTTSIGTTAPGYSASASSSGAVGATTPEASASAPGYSSSQVAPVSEYSTSTVAWYVPSYTSGYPASPSSSEAVEATTPQASVSAPDYTSSSQVVQVSEYSTSAVSQSVPVYTSVVSAASGSPTAAGYTQSQSMGSVPESSYISETVPAESTLSTLASSVSSATLPETYASSPIYETTPVQSTSVEVSASTSYIEETTRVSFAATVSTPLMSSVIVTSQTTASMPSYGNTTSTSSVLAPEATTSVSSYAQSPSTQPTSSSSSPTSTSASACQTSLSGAYQTPHLIVPISSSQPNTAFGTQYNATINSDESTIFNFDIPTSYQGKTCSVIFLFPEQADLETSAYTFSGSGDLVFSELSGAATEETTYNNAPAVEATLDTIAIQPGNSYVVATTSCAAGTTESIELSSSGGLSLEFFEDWNPSSLGLYITAC